MLVTPTQNQEETTSWTAPPETIEGEGPAIFQKIETKKKRWNTGMELEYDPVQDLFIDTETKRPVHALLDGEEDQFFDESVEVNPLEFESDNSEWIRTFNERFGLKSSLDRGKPITSKKWASLEEVLTSS